MLIDYETVWTNEWINPLNENMHKWMEILEKAKMEPERDEIKQINGMLCFHFFSTYK